MALIRKLNPQVVSYLEAVQRRNLPEIYQLTPDDARDQYCAGMRAVAGTPPEIGEVTDRVIPGPAGDIPVRLYRPPDAGPDPLPVLIYFHGGGWSFGNLDSYDHVCRWICALAGCLVAAVDYRLGPENKFPAAVEDALAAVQWVSGNGRVIGADPEKLAVGGDSAGGNLATVAALELRHRLTPPLRFQLLIYPATDMTMRCASHGEFGEGYRLTRPLMVWSAANYLSDGRDMMDPRASPLFAKNISGLPPAFILTAGFDPLRDEGKAYAQKLTDAGVAVKYHCYDDMIHGFIGMTGILDVARQALNDAAKAVSVALGH